MMKRLLLHMRLNAGDALLVYVMAFCASLLVASGFKCGDAFVVNPLPVILTCAVSVIVLMALSCRRASALAGIAVVPVLTVVALVAASGTWDGALFDDVPGNFCPILLESIVVTTVIFLLSRKRSLDIVLVVVGTLVVGYVQFVYHEDHALFVIGFYAALIAQMAFKGFQKTRRQSHMSGSGSPKALAVCAACAVALIAVGVGVHAAVIAPFNPPTMEIKLIREYVALSTLQMKGVANTASVQNDEKTTNSHNDQTELSSTKDNKEGGSSAGEEEEQLQGHNQEAYDSQSNDTGFETVTDESPLTKLPWGIILAVALVAAIIGGKFALRRRRVAKLMALPPTQQVQELFKFWLKRIKRMGLPAPGASTPSEYALRLEQHWDGLPATDGTDFATVTQIFCASNYGGKTPNDDDLAKIHTFQDAFYGNCRHHLGLPKYLIRFFVL